MWVSMIRSKRSWASTIIPTASLIVSGFSSPTARLHQPSVRRCSAACRRGRSSAVQAILAADSIRENRRAGRRRRTAGALPSPLNITFSISPLEYSGTRSKNGCCALRLIAACPKKAPIKESPGRSGNFTSDRAQAPTARNPRRTPMLLGLNQNVNPSAVQTPGSASAMLLRDQLVWSGTSKCSGSGSVCGFKVTGARLPMRACWTLISGRSH